jgi:tetratricopeptide (TPR) repeat protein
VRWKIGPLTYPRTFASKPERNAWLDSEIGNIAADLQSFADAGLDEHTWMIAYLLRDHLQLRDRTGEVLAALRIGLASARRLDDRMAQARILSSLGLAYGEDGQYVASCEYYLAARELLTQCGDEFGVAICDDSLGEMYLHLGDLAAAEQHHRQAHAVPGYLTHPQYGSHAYLQMGTLHTRLGQYPEALHQFQLCIELAQRHDVSWLTCLAYHRTALAYVQMGRREDAMAAVRDEIDLAARTICTDHEAEGRELLGDLLLATDRDKAMEAYRSALGLYDQFSTVRADRLRQRLT